MVRFIPGGTATIIRRHGIIIDAKSGASGVIFALEDKCPHNGGPLSQGLIHGNSVSCPRHNWNISLENSEAPGPDTGCPHVISTYVAGDKVFLSLAAGYRQARMIQLSARNKQLRLCFKCFLHDYIISYTVCAMGAYAEVSIGLIYRKLRIFCQIVLNFMASEFMIAVIEMFRIDIVKYL